MLAATLKSGAFLLPFGSWATWPRFSERRYCSVTRSEWSIQLQLCAQRPLTLSRGNLNEDLRMSFGNLPAVLQHRMTYGVLARIVPRCASKPECCDGLSLSACDRPLLICTRTTYDLPAAVDCRHRFRYPPYLVGPFLRALDFVTCWTSGE